MTTLAEIEAAADSLPQDQQKILLKWLAARVGQESGADARLSILDIPPVSVGSVIRLPGVGDDLLDEMLEGRL